MKNALYFLAGLTLGAIAGTIGTRLYLDKKLNDEIDESLFEEDYEEEEVINPPTKEVDPEIKEKLLKNWNKPEIGVKTEADFAESEHPVDSDEDDGLMDPDEADEFEDATDDDISLMEKSADIMDDYVRHKNDPPRFVEESEVKSLPSSIETEEWTYFTDDDTMVNDDDDVVEDYRRFIGNILDDSGWLSDNEADDALILSYEYHALYRVSKVFRAWADMAESKYGDILDKYK